MQRFFQVGTAEDPEMEGGGIFHLCPVSLANSTWLCFHAFLRGFGSANYSCSEKDDTELVCVCVYQRTS